MKSYWGVDHGLVSKAGRVILPPGKFRPADRMLMFSTRTHTDSTRAQRVPNAAIRDRDLKSTGKYGLALKPLNRLGKPDEIAGRSRELSGSFRSSGRDDLAARADRLSSQARRNSARTRSFLP